MTQQVGCMHKLSLLDLKHGLAEVLAQFQMCGHEQVGCQLYKLCKSLTNQLMARLACTTAVGYSDDNLMQSMGMALCNIS